MPVKKSPGPVPGDVCPADWLAHLRAWCQEPGPAPLLRFDTVPWPKYETLLELRPGLLRYWYEEKPLVKGRSAARLTKSDYLRLCPLLSGWHAYAPPTAEYQIL
jgi:hypothetical protein